MRSSAATQGETSASLLFFLRVSGLSEMFVIFMGVQPSPHNGVTTLPTIMPQGTHLEIVGSTITVLPGDLGTLLGSLPHSSLVSLLFGEESHCLS